MRFPFPELSPLQGGQRNLQFGNNEKAEHQDGATDQFREESKVVVEEDGRERAPELSRVHSRLVKMEAPGERMLMKVDWKTLLP